MAWNSSAQEIASVSGPALAGLMIAMTGSVPVYLTLGGFAAATLLCFALLRVRKPEPVEAAPNAPITEGLRFLWSNKLILAASSLDMFAVLFGGATALLPLYAVDILHAGPTGLGWLRAAPSIGAVGMAFILANSKKIEAAGKVLLLCVAGFGLATVIFGLSRSMALSFFALVLTGVFDNVSVVLRQSLLQTRTPDAVKGRVMAVNGIFINCSNQLGAVESGWTAGWFGPVASVVGGGLASIGIVALYWARSRELREWQR